MGSHGSAAGDQASTGATIASPEELERFATATEHRVLTEPLRGVLAETALTGRNRYPFQLIKPLLELLLEQTLRQYEQAQAADGEGPARPVIGDESLPEALSRFRTLLHGFTKAPWTIQRLCEILLNPTRQYRKLHKLALAIEKCLMVTGEVGVTPRLPPPPLLSTLQHVNDNSKCHDPQPAPHAPDRTRRASSPSGGMQDPDAEDSAAFTSTLIDVQGPPPSAHNAHGSSNGPHHAPSNNGHPGFVQFHQQQQQHHGHHWGVGHQPARHAGLENMDEDDRWPTAAGTAGGPQHPFPHHHHHHHHQPPFGSHDSDAQGDADMFSSVAEQAAAAAAAAVVAEGMEIETPAGVNVMGGQPQQQPHHQAHLQQRRGGGAVDDAGAAAAEAAAQAVVGGLDQGHDSAGVRDSAGHGESAPHPSTTHDAAAAAAEGSPKGAPAQSTQQGLEEESALAASAGSPAAAANKGEQERGEVCERVPATPPFGMSGREEAREGQEGGK
uniref:Serine/threonine-protein phosphatase 4 regulatory subunit 2 n=1 Tax=Dunaliella tertiolecta TaxID=3047 RepID=A0A7S3VKR3_DUNTE